MNHSSNRSLTSADEAWQAEKGHMLKDWGREVEDLIRGYRNDQALWDAERQDMQDRLRGLKAQLSYSA